MVQFNFSNSWFGICIIFHNFDFLRLLVGSPFLEMFDPLWQATRFVQFPRFLAFFWLLRSRRCYVCWSVFIQAGPIFITDDVTFLTFRFRWKWHCLIRLRRAMFSQERHETLKLNYEMILGWLWKLLWHLVSHVSSWIGVV